MIPGDDKLRIVVISFGFQTLPEECVNQEFGVWGCLAWDVFDITFGFIIIMEQMLDQHGFSELSIVDAALVLYRFWRIWERPWGIRVKSESRWEQALGRGRGGVLPRMVIKMRVWLGSPSRRLMTQRVGGFKTKHSRTYRTACLHMIRNR